MDKKGVDLSVNVIIVAAIALAVLVVLFMIFTGRLGLFSKGVAETTTCDQACKAAGHIGRSSTSGCAGPNEVKLIGYYDEAVKDRACCCTKAQVVGQ